MIMFQNDYVEGAHPAVLKKLVDTNMEQSVGYGEDPYCEKARARIREAIGREDADVHFLVGGTQTNLTVISAALRPHQGALCAETGHIHVHETGSVEACGHKVLAMPGQEGKITAKQVNKAYESHWTDGARIWCSQSLYTFPIRRSLVRYTRSRSLWICGMSAMHVDCIFSWTGRDLLTDLRRMGRM